MPVTTSLHPITINDFTPGIADDPGFKYPPGQATQAGTFRCRAKPSGALIPGPKLIATIPGDHFTSPTPTLTPGYVIDGIHAVGPIIDPTLSPASVSAFCEVFIGTEFALNQVGNVADKHFRLQRIQLYEATNFPKENIVVTDQAGVAQFSNSWGMTFADSRANKASPTTPGVPVVYMAWGTSTTPATGAFIIEFPNDATPTSSTPFSLTADANAWVFAHQGRAVMAFSTAYSHGSVGQLFNYENLRWTAVNDPTLANFSVSQAFYPELANGYTDIASMSANQLFLLKPRNAIAISGDLDNPLVTNLPMVAGGGNTPNLGTHCRQGYLYLSDTSGAWIWSHGDSSTHISQKLSAKFWLPPFGGAVYNISPVSSCCNDANLVFVPNNWMYDTDTQAWWRTDDISTTRLVRWWTNWNNNVFGARTSYTNAVDDAVFWYDTFQSATSYSWQSHPLMETIDTYTEVREISLRAQGTGTVQFNVTNQAGTTNIHTFTFAAAFPQLQRANFSIQGDNLTIGLIATGTGGNPAPTIYEATISTHEAQPVGVS